MRQIVSKGHLMRLVAVGLHHESFEHSIEGLFDITEMRKAVKEYKIPFEVREIDLPPIIPFIKQSRVYEQARVDELSLESWSIDPGIFLECEDGTHLMVDGTHRAIRRDQEGLANMYFVFIPMKYACRPSPGWVPSPQDWGDKLENGVIVRRA